MDKDFLDKYDIMSLFECGESKAMCIIRSIKNYTKDHLGLKGKVLKTEYEAWKNGVLAKANNP